MPTALIIGMPVEAIRPGTIRKPPPMPKNPLNAPVPSPIPEHLGRILAVARGAGSALGLAAAQHQHADDDHQQREQEQQLLAVDALAEGRTGEVAPTTPAPAYIRPQRQLHVAVARVVDQAGRGIGGHRQRARADRDVRAL